MRSFRTAQASHTHLLSDTTCLLNILQCPEVKKKKKNKKNKKDTQLQAARALKRPTRNGRMPVATQESHAASSFVVQGEAPRQAFAPVRGFLDVDRMLVRESDRKYLVWSGWK